MAKDWTNRKGIIFNSTKCKIVYLETADLGTYQLEMTREVKDMIVLFKHRMTMRHQCDAAEEKTHVPV